MPATVPRRAPRGVAVAAAGLLAAAACGGSDAAPAATGDEPKTASVAVARLAYGPGELTVPAGTTVTWTNDEPITHTVTSGTVTGVDKQTGLRAGEQPDGKFDGPLGAKGATFAFRFADPGTYSYYCAIHKGMNASVLVT